MACKTCQSHDHHEHEHNHENNHEDGKIMATRLIIGLILFVMGFYFNNSTFYIISYVTLGYDVIFSAIKNIRYVFSEHLLMTIATLGAIYIDKIPEAVSVMMFYQFGELLSDFAVEKSKKSIGNLIDLRSDFANVLFNDTFSPMPSKSVKIGEIIRVSAGEKIPLDGIIIEGSAYLDTKSLTGESVPKKMSVGDEVLSGMICTDSVLKIKVTKLYEDSTASKILKLINDDKKSKSEKFITKFSKIYTPIVVLIALLITLVPSILGYEFKVWFYRSMLFLVVSCPCALVVSIPLSFFAGLGCASKNGILIKGAFALENASKLNSIAFDKTGTLTEGNFSVQTVQSTKYSKYDLLKYAASCEYHSSHPIAKAIKLAFNEEIDEGTISDYHETAGNGVSAKVNSHLVKVGTKDFINSSENADNAVFISIDNEYAGYIQIFDKIKDNAKASIDSIKKLKINPIMLTGDTKENATPISNRLGINYFSNLLPQDKVSKLKELQKDGFVGFVGDGINDAPVLSISDVGISMGNVGSDAAIEASDVVIVSDNLEKIPHMIKIARKTMQIVKENIILALSVKIIIMILGAFGIASMWLAVFADVGVCILALLNSLRAFFVRD